MTATSAPFPLGDDIVAGLFELDAARLAGLPENPVTVEAHIRPSGSADLVVGYSGDKLAPLFGWIDGAVDDAARPRVEAFTAAVSERVLDAGAQIGSRKLQVYLRGRFDAAAIAGAFTAAGQQVEAVAAKNALLLFGLEHAEMIGLEIGESINGAMYLSLANRGGRQQAALAHSIKFLLDAQLPDSDAGALWDRVATSLLECPREEWVYVSMPPVRKPGWVKVDVGLRPLARAAVIARAIDAEPVEPMLDRARRYKLDPVAHLGVRFGGDRPRVSIYGALA